MHHPIHCCPNERRFRAAAGGVEVAEERVGVSEGKVNGEENRDERHLCQGLVSS